VHSGKRLKLQDNTETPGKVETEPKKTSQTIACSGNENDSEAELVSESDETLSTHSDVSYNNFELQAYVDQYEKGSDKDTAFNSDSDGWEREDYGFGSEDELS
jgi:hypothetical protein